MAELKSNKKGWFFLDLYAKIDIVNYKIMLKYLLILLVVYQTITRNLQIISMDG